ncbi:MAG: hypothetical protein L0Y44_02015 [Phycisphaerales bacterium]|nr:hypothetical protein [Phycisphaerales bacterium]MCI0629413.1 hypothetical protein [Phycisphaerales bacterium]MCI0675228.1 hypothetical protein [Phycisphaerales bacterium]
MVYHGQVKNGKIILDDPVRLPEGAKVRVDLVDSKDIAASNGDADSLYDELGPFIGSVRNLPADAARNVDHYLYGRPKR